jgi:hypothetical protein
VVLEGTPLMLPTAQAMSDVGKRVKSAVEQEEELTDGAVDVEVRDISVVVTFSRGVVRKIEDAKSNVRTCDVLSGKQRSSMSGVRGVGVAVCCSELFV